MSVVDQVEDVGFRHFKEWPEPLKSNVRHLIEMMIADKTNDINDYGDNWRICRKANINEVAAYEESVRNGCCGSFDGDFEVDGIKIRFGFNFGH